MNVRSHLFRLILASGISWMLGHTGAVQAAWTRPHHVATNATYDPGCSDCTLGGTADCGNGPEGSNGCGGGRRCGKLLHEFLHDLKSGLRRVGRWRRCGCSCRGCRDRGGAAGADGGGWDFNEASLTETTSVRAEPRSVRHRASDGGTVELVPRPWPPEYQAPLPPRRQTANPPTRPAGPHRPLARQWRPRLDRPTAQQRTRTRENGQPRAASLRLHGPMPDDEEPARVVAVASDSLE